MSVKDKIDQICGVCDMEAELQCQRCRQSYCSSECQNSDWTQHKLTCFPMPRLVKKQSNTLSLRPPQPATVAYTREEPQATVQNTASSSSLFNNPFKRNSQNIGFQSNDLRKYRDRKSQSPDKKKEIPNIIKKISERQDMFDKNTAVKKTINSELVRVSVKNPLKIADEPIKTSALSNGVDALTKRIFMKKLEHKEAESQRQEKMTINDIDIVPIPAGSKLYCSDYSNIKKGYVSACAYEQRALAHIDKLCAKITDYCQRMKETYSPQANELCLCLYKNDDKWYRAVVEKVIDSNTFEIEFIDFGNKTSVSSSDIRKISPEFVIHCLVNKCYIKNFPKDLSDNEIMKMAVYFDENPVFQSKEVECKDGRYVIDVKY